MASEQNVVICIEILDNKSAAEKTAPLDLSFCRNYKVRFHWEEKNKKSQATFFSLTFSHSQSPRVAAQYNHSQLVSICVYTTAAEGSVLLRGISNWPFAKLHSPKPVKLSVLAQHTWRMWTSDILGENELYHMISSFYCQNSICTF